MCFLVLKEWMKKFVFVFVLYIIYEFLLFINLFNSFLNFISDFKLESELIFWFCLIEGWFCYLLDEFLYGNGIVCFVNIDMLVSDFVYWKVLFVFWRVGFWLVIWMVNLFCLYWFVFYLDGFFLRIYRYVKEVGYGFLCFRLF